MFRHPYRYLFLLLLSLYAFLNTVFCDVYHYFQIRIEWYNAFLIILAITFITWELNRFLEPLMQRRLPPTRNKARYLIGFFAVGTGLSLLATVLIVVVAGQLLHGYSWQQNLNPQKLNIIYAGLLSLFFHLLNSIYFFFQENKRQWAEVAALRKSSDQAQIQLIKNQINPHFLFNNLNVLSGMVVRDNPDANHFIEEFSKVYRYVLANQEKELVELGHELEFVQPYLYLLRKRFDAGLQVELSISADSRKQLVIPIALQMLIENAIKHNVVSQSRPLRIEIYANGNQSLVVRNNLQPRQRPEPSGRVGLQNIRQRYELISGRAVIVRKTDTLFEVELPLLSLN